MTIITFANPERDDFCETGARNGKKDSIGFILLILLKLSQQ